MKKIIILALLTITIFLISCGGKTMTGQAIIETNIGTITLKLFTDEMPITTGNFIKLAQEGFYDGTRFHRVIGPRKAPPSGFMIQGGDPLSKDIDKQDMWGTGGPGYKIKDEFTANNRNDKGTISMANAGPNTGGSQFFINLADNNFLDDKHPAFGKVVEGMHIVKKIGDIQTQGPDRPVEEVVIEKITIK